jgi:hypothetical protein
MLKGIYVSHYAIVTDKEYDIIYKCIQSFLWVHELCLWLSLTSFFLFFFYLYLLFSFFSEYFRPFTDSETFFLFFFSLFLSPSLLTCTLLPDSLPSHSSISFLSVFYKLYYLYSLKQHTYCVLTNINIKISSTYNPHHSIISSKFHLPRQTKIWENAFKRTVGNRDCGPKTLINKTSRTPFLAWNWHYQSVKTLKIWLF